jgi:hypothetical protein
VHWNQETEVSPSFCNPDWNLRTRKFRNRQNVRWNLTACALRDLTFTDWNLATLISSYIYICALESGDLLFGDLRGEDWNLCTHKSQCRNALPLESLDSHLSITQLVRWNFLPDFFSLKSFRLESVNSWLTGITTRAFSATMRIRKFLVLGREQVPISSEVSPPPRAVAL